MHQVEQTFGGKWSIAILAALIAPAMPGCKPEYKPISASTLVSNTQSLMNDYVSLDLRGVALILTHDWKDTLVADNTPSIDCHFHLYTATIDGKNLYILTSDGPMPSNVNTARGRMGDLSGVQSYSFSHYLPPDLLPELQALSVSAFE